ncbi:WD repeat-containing protein [Aureococcus anophagefferens]|nr:WD repeat-containing protein [Aureococcus anophagefferens]
MGSIAVLGDLDDPHAQKLLRAHDEPISALATSVDGSLLASGQRVNILEFSDDMRFLAACGEDCVLYVWDATSGEVVFGKRYAKRLSLFQWIGAMDRGRRRVYRLATAVTGVAEVVVWDLSTYDAIATTKRACAAPKGRPADAAERPRRVAQFGDGATCLAWVTDVAVVAGYGDCHVRCFSAADGALEWAIPTAHRRPVSAIACHVEQKLAYLVTGSEDGSVRVWNLSTREVMMQFAEHHKGVTGLVVDAADPRLFHSGGLDCARKDSERELITCDANGRVLFWDCDVRAHSGVSVDGTTVACVAVSPSGRYFVLCRDEMLTIFELDANSATAHPKPIAEGWAHSANVTKVQWSPDERQLVSIGADSCICIWNFFGTSD